jgi:hypothetical protein
MTLYAAILFLHLFGVVTLFFAFGIEWAAVSFLRSAKSLEEVQSWMRLARLAPIINGPALLLAILSGGYLASLISAFKQGWIPASFLGIAVVALLGGVLNAPKMRALRLASSNGYEAVVPILRSSVLPVSVRLRTFTTLSIVFMMAAKLSLASSMLVLFAGLVVGFLLSIPALASKNA